MLKRHKKKMIVLAVLVAASLYLFWPGFQPNLSAPPTLYLKNIESFGRDTGKGNVVGIEPYMESLDYATPGRFREKLAGYLDAAKKQGWINKGTIVLLPEHIGTWLMASGQKSRVYEAENLTSAMLPIATHNLGAVAKSMFIFDDKDALSAAIIRAMTTASAKAQYDVYGSLAREYGVTLVAGSSALMTPGVYAGRLSYGHGPIFNAGFVFGPDGKPQTDAIRKVHPIPSEAGFTKASKAKFLPTFGRDGIRFGVLICADSWFDNTTAHMANEGADLLLVPAFLTGASWDTPWGGYLSDKPSGQSWRHDVGAITEGQAWIKYALPAKAKAHGINWGMTVFLKGNLWGNKGSGRALILENGALHMGKGGDDGAALYNLWLS